MPRALRENRLVSAVWPIAARGAAGFFRLVLSTSFGHSSGFFAKLFKRRLKRGVFCSLVDLQAAINRFIAEHNKSPKPFVWRADPHAIIAAHARGFQALESNH
jgi:hypothetical protein